MFDKVLNTPLISIIKLYIDWWYIWFVGERGVGMSFHNISCVSTVYVLVSCVLQYFDQCFNSMKKNEQPKGVSLIVLPPPLPFSIRGNEIFENLLKIGETNFWKISGGKQKGGGGGAIF